MLVIPEGSWKAAGPLWMEGLQEGSAATSASGRWRAEMTLSLHSAAGTSIRLCAQARYR
jgi:hypothetical protein